MNRDWGDSWTHNDFITTRYHVVILGYGSIRAQRLDQVNTHDRSGANGAGNRCDDEDGAGDAHLVGRKNVGQARQRWEALLLSNPALGN